MAGTHTRVVTTVLAIVAFILVPLNWCVKATGPAITVDGSQFKIDGVAQFLVLVSYFDAVDADDKRDSDFDQLRALGVNGVRIFPNWWTVSEPNGDPTSFAGDTLIAPNGSVRSGVLDSVIDTINTAATYGLIVDISFSMESVGEEDAAVSCSNQQLSLANATSAIASIAGSLTGYSNVIFDLQNESNGNGPGCGNPLSDNAVAAMVTAVHNADSSRLVTASVDSNLSAASAGARAAYSGQDFVSYHESRTSEFWLNTGDVVADLSTYSGGLPVYLQEPGRLGDGLYSADDALNAVSYAYWAGAAAWTFHTSAGFYMNGGADWFSNLDPSGCDCGDADTERGFLANFRTGQLQNNLLSYNEYYLGYSGSAGVATAGSAGSGETFTVVNYSHPGVGDGGAIFDGDLIALKLNNNYYYSAEDGGGDGKVLLTNSTVGDNEKFIVYNLSRCGGTGTDCHAAILRYDRVALMTANGRFLRAEGGGNDIISAASTSVGSYEQFAWIQ